MVGCCCCHTAAMTRDEHVQAEEALLESGLAWWQTTHQPNGEKVSFTVMDVPLRTLAKRDLFIHTVEYTCGTADPDASAMVLVHGFGFGAGLYFSSAPALAAAWNGRLFSIDQLGCGLSSRPPWPHEYGHRCSIDTAENYFVDALEAWRTQLGLESLVLVGHSIGGYTAAAYAERHPERVHRLVLASPAGVPPPPPGLAEVHASQPWPMKLARTLFLTRGWSPFFIAKDLGRGRTALAGYLGRRFEHGQGWIPKAEILEYLVGIWCRSPKSAGGYMHALLLTFGGIPEGSQGEFVYARRPLAERLLVLAHRVPRVACIYGEFDWMYWRNAADVRARQAPDAPPIDVWRVAQATHQQMMDNPLGFADAVLACAGDRTPAGSLPVGAGFGRSYGAKAKIFQRRGGRQLPQDTDVITVWAEDVEASSTI